MQKSKRFPIPEKLLNKPNHYWLKIDSIIHGIYTVEPMIQECNVPPDLKAPKNSDVSEENFSIGNLSEDEDELALRRKSQAKDLPEDVVKEKIFDKTLVDL